MFDLSDYCRYELLKMCPKLPPYLSTSAKLRNYDGVIVLTEFVFEHYLFVLYCLSHILNAPIIRNHVSLSFFLSLSRSPFLAQHTLSPHSPPSIRPSLGWYHIARHACPYCFRTYANKKGLDRHQKFECTYVAQRERFRCPYCSHTSKRKDNLRQHVFKHLRFDDDRRLRWRLDKANGIAVDGEYNVDEEEEEVVSNQEVWTSSNAE